MKKRLLVLTIALSLAATGCSSNADPSEEVLQDVQESIEVIAESITNEVLQSNNEVTPEPAEESSEESEEENVDQVAETPAERALEAVLKKDKDALHAVLTETNKPMPKKHDLSSDYDHFLEMYHRKSEMDSEYYFVKYRESGDHVIAELFNSYGSNPSVDHSVEVRVGEDGSLYLNNSFKTGQSLFPYQPKLP